MQLVEHILCGHDINGILDREKYIIFDTSIEYFDEVHKDWYYSRVFNSRSFSDLDADFLSTVSAGLGEVGDFLSLPNIHAPRGVFQEFDFMKKIVKDKLLWLNRHPKEINYRRFELAKDVDVLERKKFLEDICFCYHRICKKISSVLFQPGDVEKYKMFEDSVIDVTERTGSKIDYSSRYETDRRKLKAKSDFHTDEQIVACAFYNSIVDNCSSGIITNDYDISRIASNFFLNLHDNRASNVFLLDSLYRNPVRVYDLRNEDTPVLFDSSLSVGSLRPEIV